MGFPSLFREESLFGNSNARLRKEAAMATPTLPGSAPEQVYLGRFSGKFVVFAIVFTLSALAGVELLTDAFTAHDFNATASGTLDDNYTQVTTHNNGSTSVSYEVTYTFTVNGQQYKGKDTVSTEPQDPACTVYYMKDNPAENGLEPGHVDAKLRNFGFGFLALALIAYIWGQWKQFAAGMDRSQVAAAAANVYAVGPPATEVRLQYGDAARENVGIKHGKYSAWVHVHIAFFAQILVLGVLVALLLTHVDSGMTQIRAYGIAIVVAILVTLWVYFDRWRCVEAVASKSCSGVANLSLFYVPIVAAVYANYRGLRKLAGK